MKKLLILLFCTINAQAQVQLAASYFKEAELAGRNQRIWAEPIYGPMLFVDPNTRLTYANTPDKAGILKPEGGIYTGTLPKDVMIANTSIHWQGQTWSVILWPLPADQNERMNLVMHESFHRIQEKIGFPGKSPTADHLSTMDGRIYFLLELNALKTALQKPVSQRQGDLANALAFREKRQLLFPNTFENERVLEMNEGLAEYTGATLGRPEAEIRPHLYKQIDTAGERKSLIRSCAYLTGPIYGLLLKEKAPDWTMKIDSTADFAKLIVQYYHINASKSPDETKYHGAEIRLSEKQKEEKRQQIAAGYIEVFTKQPVLTITLVKMGVVFNPNNLFDLGQYGTVYPTAEIKDTWGYLKVTDGMLMKDWHIVTLPVTDPTPLTGSGVINGNGWTITLAENWKLIKTDALHYTLSDQP